MLPAELLGYHALRYSGGILASSYITGQTEVSAQGKARDFLSLGFILVCGFLVRFFWISSRGFGIFNSDQAVIGLMAKHILEGKPMVYFYGQGYMGSLEAFIAAAFFAVRGMTLSSLQCAPLFFYFGFLIINFYLLKKVFGFGVSFTANLLLAVSPSSLSILSMTSLGGYPETLFFGSLVLYGWICYEESRSEKVLFLTGLAAGVGFWVNNLILMYFISGALLAFLRSDFWKQHYSRKGFTDFFFLRFERAPLFLRIPAVFFHFWLTGFLVWHLTSFFLGPREISILGHSFHTASPVFHVKKVKFILEILFVEGALAALFHRGIQGCIKLLHPAIPFLAGFLIGGSPAFLYSLLGGEGYRLIHGAGMVYFKELPAQFHEVLGEGLFESILAVPGHALFHGTPLAAVQAWSILFFSAVLLLGLPPYYLKEWRQFLRLRPFSYSQASYSFMMLAVNLGICLFCNLKSCRYLMPLYFSVSLIFALAAANLFKRNKGLAYVLVFGMLLNYGFANYLSIQETPSRAELRQDYVKAISELEAKGVRAGFADYWLSYEMTFLAQEKVVIAPYHSEDRYPAYTQFSGSQEKAAYLFLKVRKEDEAFEKTLISSGIPYEKKEAGEIRFFIVNHRGAV